MTLLKENDIYSMDDIDKEFTQKFVDAGIETVDHCFQCGTCGGGCPSGRCKKMFIRTQRRSSI